MGAPVDVGCTSCGGEIEGNQLQCSACASILHVVRPTPRHGQTGPIEPCVNCEDEAAASWLLCLKCAAALDETMLLRLTKKQGELERWCVAAEEILQPMSRRDSRFAPGWKMFQIKLRVYERLGWLNQSVRFSA